ncbi:MAG: hypothetical protein ACYC0H_06055 [Solirubrobacteraceae bacterium]
MGAVGAVGLAVPMASTAVAAAHPAFFRCAKLPATAPRAGITTTVSTSLGATNVTYRATSRTATTVPAPGVGLPFPGMLRVSSGATSTTLPSPSGFAGSAVVQLCALADGSRPAVLLGAYSGGAHCCFESALYAPAGPGYVLALDANLQSVRPAIRYDPNGGLAPAVTGGDVVLKSADGRFPYRFGCYACTPSPLVLYQLRGAHIVDVTSLYPALARRYLTSLTEALRQSESPGNSSSLFGVLAAFVAQSCTLGSGARAWREVTSLELRGLLSDTAYHQAAFVKNGAYVPALRRFLLAAGYCRGTI